MATTEQVFLGELWHINAKGDFEATPEGALAVDPNGQILKAGKASDVRKKFPNFRVTDYGHCVLLPGFVDAHLHFPQLDIIGCYGETLLGWLEKYTFPEEALFAAKEKFTAGAERFFDQLLMNGTTFACTYSSSHYEATDHLFACAEKRGMRAIIGKISMDQNAPKALLTDPDEDYEQSCDLIHKWHKRDNRLFYALTPRFAPSCSEEMLGKMQELKKKYPDVYTQTHYAECEDELRLVKKCFPKYKNYLDVYDRFDLLGERTLLGHGIHVSDDEFKRLKKTGTKVVHCPTSNLFLGSGLFPMGRYAKHDVSVLLGSDIGGGTSISMWKTMAEAYKIQRLLENEEQFTPTQLLNSVTLGAAKALGFENALGNFEKGKWADFQVLDWKKNDLLKERFTRSKNPQDRLFAMINMADDRLTSAVYVGGKLT